MTTNTLIAYLLAEHPANLSLYDILENYCSIHNLDLDITDTPPAADASEHNRLIYTLLHRTTNY